MKTARIYTDDLNRIIQATKDFVNHGSARPTHQYINLKFDAEFQTVTAVAVDGYRMSVEHAAISDCEETFSVYIKPGIKLPRRNYATFTLENDEVFVRCNGFVFGYKQPEPIAFDWEKVIPKNEATFKIGFNGNYLLSALQAARASCGDGFKSPVVLEFRGPLSPVVLRTNKEDIKLVLPVRMKEV